MKFFSTGNIMTAAVLVAAFTCPSARAAAGPDDEALKKRIAVLEAGQKEILRQLQELRALLPQNRPPQPPVSQAPGAPAQPSNVSISIEGAAARGKASAKLVIVEFSDFQCPFCGRYTRETLGQLEREYVDTGKVRYVFRHFPLEKIHPNAFKAAEAGECARQQGKFWELHDRLFANQQTLADRDLLNHATAVGLDGLAFQRCVTGTVDATIRRDLAEGGRLGIAGTPAFFLGTVQKDGKVQVLRKLNGAQPFAAFKTAIDALLGS